MSKIQALLIQERGEDRNYDSFYIETNNPDNVLAQLKGAVEDYCKEQYAKGNEPFMDFNWRDAIKEMPKEAWEKHGIEPAPITSIFQKSDLPKVTLNVNQDEILLPSEMQKELKAKDDQFRDMFSKIVTRDGEFSREEGGKLLKSVINELNIKDNILKVLSKNQGNEKPVNISKNDGIDR